MLRGELSPLTTEIEDKTTMFRRDDAPIRAAATAKKWFQDFGVGSLPWPASSPEPNSIQNPRGIPTRKVYGPDKPAIENIVKLEKKWNKPAWADIRNETLNNSADSILNGRMRAIKSKEKSIKRRAKS